MLFGVAAAAGSVEAIQTPSKMSAADWLEVARVAIGGETRIASVKSIVLKGDQRSYGEAVNVKTGQTIVSYTTSPTVIRVLLPDCYMFQREVRLGSMPARLITFGVAGSTAFDSGGVVWADAVTIQRERLAELMLLMLLKTDTATPLTLRAGSVADATVEFTVGTGFHGYLDLDPATHLPRRLRYRQVNRTRTGEPRGDMSDVVEAVKDAARRDKIRKWMLACTSELGVDAKIAKILTGAVFEVRQGYKSKDSKRQNADPANAATAYTQRYLPVVLLLSAQIDGNLVLRYRTEKWVILRGTLKDSPTRSTYTFCQDVIGYDLAGFFKRNSPAFKTEIDKVFRSLLSP